MHPNVQGEAILGPLPDLPISQFAVTLGRRISGTGTLCPLVGSERPEPNVGDKGLTRAFLIPS